MTIAVTAMKHGAILAVFAIAVTAFGADAPYNSGAPSDAYQVGIAVNLAVGDSFINMTNAGINGVGNPTSSSSICVNNYVFDNATMVSCCSTRLPANGLQSYSVKNDLAPPGPSVPTSLVIKFVATDPVDNSCSTGTNSAGVAGRLVGGLAVIATTLHSTPTPGTYATTNSPFQTKILGVGEYQKLTSQCAALLQASGGVCRGARLGGL